MSDYYAQAHLQRQREHDLEMARLREQRAKEELRKLKLENDKRQLENEAREHGIAVEKDKALDEWYRKNRALIIGHQPRGR